MFLDLFQEEAQENFFSQGFNFKILNFQPRKREIFSPQKFFPLT